MRHLAEYRQPQLVHSLVREIRRSASRRWSLMEICGGQTHSIVRHGLEQLLSQEVEFLHGPGCPVCVTPAHQIDQAIALSRLPGVTVCSYGDMLRVPGSQCSLLQARGEGAQIEIVYSPLDVLRLAQGKPEREFVFFGVGFETTTPATAMAVQSAHARGLRNFSVLVAHVVVPPVVHKMLSDEEQGIHALLAPGHVCAIVGVEDYVRIAQRFGLPVVVTGFEPVDILRGVLQCVQSLEAGHSGVHNQYARVVEEAGNRPARGAVEQVFEGQAQRWRGIGIIEGGGLTLRKTYRALDAERRFERPLNSLRALEESPGNGTLKEDGSCIAGQVLLGKKRPQQCPAFGKECTPQRPLGAPMVSTEGACAAYYRYSNFSFSTDRTVEA